MIATTTNPFLNIFNGNFIISWSDPYCIAFWITFVVIVEAFFIFLCSRWEKGDPPLIVVKLMAIMFGFMIAFVLWVLAGFGFEILREPSRLTYPVIIIAFVAVNLLIGKLIKRYSFWGRSSGNSRRKKKK